MKMKLKVYNLSFLGMTLLGAQVNGMSQLTKPLAKSSLIKFADVASRFRFFSSLNDETIDEMIDKKMLTTDFMKIIPGKTVGFDHNKFFTLRNRLIADINSQEIKLLHKISSTNKKFSYHDLDPKNPVIRGKLSEFFEYSQEIPHVDSADLHYLNKDTIVRLCKQNALNPTQISINIQTSLGRAALSTTFVPSNPVLHYLNISKTQLPVLKPANAAQKLKEQLFESGVIHELCHIKHNDALKLVMLQINECSPTVVDEMANICEERADIYSVFNCPNPIFTSILLGLNSIEGYAHRIAPRWKTQTAEISSCYDKQILEHTMGLVEHINE